MSTITPRTYQVNGILKLREKIIFDKKKRIILMCPTGGGKGLIMAMLADMALKKGSKLLTILYGSDLIIQTQENYKRYYDIDSQIIMADYKSKPSNSIIASISTLHRRKLPDADFIIIDECHQSKSDSYKKILEHYKDKIIIGFSATPFNHLDNYEDCIVLASVQELIDQGFLVKPRHFKPKRATIKTDGLKIVKGEWQDEDLEREALKITGDIIGEWLDRAKDRPTVIFCVNVKHSIELADAFNNAGIPAIHIDGETPTEERSRAIASLKSGEIKIITNVNVFSTGIDCPEISCVGLARPTHSEILYIQQVGRGLRPAKNKNDCIIIDYADNYSRHDLVTIDRQPVITPKDKKKKSKDDVKEIKVWLCQACFYTNPHNVTVCEDCQQPKPIKETEVKTSSGELEEISAPLKSKKRKIYLGNTMPFGKYNGIAFENLPYSFLQWAVASFSDYSKGLRHRLEIELQRRDQQ